MKPKGKVAALRREYHYGKLDFQDLDARPLKQFEGWFEEALQRRVDLPNAMVLATASKGGKPSARVMLLKDYDSRGFVFYTHYSSPKGEDLTRNPHAAILFHWPEYDRQVRIEGHVRKISRKESERYFHSRPRMSQIAAWIGRQSMAVSNREALDDRFKELQIRFQGKKIPLPPSWGGYRVVPAMFEFWQGRENRLNDRFRYRLKSRCWILERLHP